MRQVVNTMKALSSENRLRMLNLLLVRDCCIYEVTRALGISQPQVSRDLGTLFDVGILKRRRERTRVIYTVDTKANPEIIKIIKEVLGNNSVAKGDRERLLQINK